MSDSPSFSYLELSLQSYLLKFLLHFRKNQLRQQIIAHPCPLRSQYQATLAKDTLHCGARCRNTQGTECWQEQLTESSAVTS